MTAAVVAAAAPLAPGDREDVERLVRASGTSFFWAMRLLPQDKREAMFAIYAFCRVVDDIADDPGEEAAKRAELADWRREIERVYDGRPQRTVGRALLSPVRRFRLDRGDFIAIIDGMEMDAGDRVRIADLRDLELYCDRVACAVGRLSVRVFGLPEALGIALANALGQALQLTNILRDVREDAARDRLYLPQDLLFDGRPAAVGGAEQQLRAGAAAAVCERLAALAEARFAEAAALAARCDRRQVRPAVMMMEVYRRTFHRLRRRGWQRWAEPVCVSSAEKLWVALRYGTV